MKKIAANTALGFVIGGGAFVLWTIIFNFIATYG